MYSVWKLDEARRVKVMVFFGLITDCLAYVENDSEPCYITREPIDSFIYYED